MVLSISGWPRASMTPSILLRLASNFLNNTLALFNIRKKRVSGVVKNGAPEKAKNPVISATGAGI
jgi:hypothetical protein